MKLKWSDKARQYARLHSRDTCKQEEAKQEEADPSLKELLDFVAAYEPVYYGEKKADVAETSQEDRQDKVAQAFRKVFDLIATYERGYRVTNHRPYSKGQRSNVNECYT